ncbi:MAG: VTT domain-containing protein [Acidocella sp.]|nr:VTT domain-containing protein [Acidocella sp.]
MLQAHFTALLAAAASAPAAQAAIIILGTFILEDAATLAAAMQVATGAIALPVALGALYTGIVLGDLGLYGLGRLAAKHPWALRLIPARRRDLSHQWVNRRLIPLVLVSRFVPGLRLPTYTSLGFLRARFTVFALAAIVATLAWTSLLFVVSLKLGVLLMRYLGIWRWAGLGLFLILLVVTGRLAATLYNKRTIP